MTVLLDVKNLRVRFRNLQAVRGISFSLEEGKILGIVGESGCGKSSVAKALVRLLSPHSSCIEGEITYAKTALSALSEKEMQKIRGKEIGMIFQDPMTSLNPTLKIGRQIIEGFQRHHPEASLKEAENYALSLLELVGISDPHTRLQEYPHTLSGGMRQRVMIALALAPKPKLLIADEPTTALDVTIQAQILTLLKEIQQTMKMSMLLITHDMSVIAGFCDHVLVMYAGQIVESAPTLALFSNPAHPYTKRLLQAIPRLDMPRNKPLIPIEGSPPNLLFPPKGCAFCARCDEAFKICNLEEPPLYPAGPNHQSACFHLDPRNPHRKNL